MALVDKLEGNTYCGFQSTTNEEHLVLQDKINLSVVSSSLYVKMKGEDWELMRDD